MRKRTLVVPRDEQARRPLRTLYISYFGALKHLCQTQVIPYLKELRDSGIEVTLLSFEERPPRGEDEAYQRAQLRAELSAVGIDWRPLRYHKRPSLPATMFDVLQGTLYAFALITTKKIDVVHARNAVPAVTALLAQRLLGTKLLFDMRGVMAEEYLDAGLWTRNSLAFWITKWVENRVLRNADAIVMLTRKIRDTLRNSSAALQKSSAPIEVIPCCVDLDQYRGVDGQPIRVQLGLEKKKVLVYAGSLGGWYLVREMVEFFRAGQSRWNDLHFLVLTQSSYEMIRTLFDQYRVNADHYTLLTVSAREMPRYLAAGDLAISLIKPCYSKLSSSPTKIGEYLAAGLPIVSSRGIGDVDELIEREQVGALLDTFDAAGYSGALVEMNRLFEEGPRARARCRQAAEKHFSLAKVGRRGYLRIYETLGGPSWMESEER